MSHFKTGFLAAFLMLATALPALADNYYYRDRRGPSVTNLGNGQFEMTYLTYDFAGLDDYLQEMAVYVKIENEYHHIFLHQGNHGDNKIYYNNGFGELIFQEGDMSVENLETTSRGDECYRKIRVTLPERFWGNYRIRVIGTFCYEKNDSSPLRFDYELDPNDLGVPRFSNSPTFVGVDYAYPGAITVGLDNVQCINGATTTLKTYIDETLADTYTLSDGNLSGARSAQYTFNCDNFDGGKSHTFKVVTEVSFAGRISSSTVIKTVEAYATATNLKGEFNTVTRSNTLSWEISNPGEYGISGVSVQRRPYGSSPWTELARLMGTPVATQYIDSDHGNLQCGRRYEYRVVLLPENADASAIITKYAWSGGAETDITMKPELDINMSATREPHGATIGWDIPHSPEFEGHTITLWRTLPGGGQKTEVAQLLYSGNGTGSYTDTDIDGVYKYYITLDATGSWYHRMFTSPTVQVQTINSATVRDLRISKGEYESIVHIEWDVDNVEPYGGGTQPERTTYTLFRRSLEASDSEFTRVYTVSTNDEYNIWEDKNVRPGIYYEYMLNVAAICNDEARTEVESTMTGVGFSISLGKITGTISYGTGTAVAGVDVVALPTSTGDDVTSSRCLEFSGSGSTSLKCTAEKLNKLFNDGRGFSMQMWINPQRKTTTGNYLLANIGDAWQLELQPSADGNSFTLAYTLPGTAGGDVIVAGIAADTYSHLTLTCKDGLFAAVVHTPDPQSDIVNILSGTASAAVPSAEITTDRTFNLGGAYCGKIDDFRLWNRALDAEETESNFNRSLTGSESGLEIYWRFDEGLDDYFFDSSRKGTAMNGNHGTISAGVASSTLVPPARYLSYRAVTDTDGNYMIDGIPFAADGTAYSVVPTLGIHEFKPNKLLRYIGSNSLVHNATDFTDVSSFPVSGKVYYEHTTYPVADCTFYVDGVIASREGKMVTTAADGTFSIDVPIGDHHIEVRKDGHTFVSAGRYPEDADNVGTKHTFDREITGLTFYDTTLVNFAGRVTGGAIEGKKPLGFGQSLNTIGEVQLSLVPQDDRYRLNVLKQVTEASVEYVTNTEKLPCASVASDLCEIQSTSWRGAGDEDRTRIFINTDPATGEFSAKLPPLKYVIESAKVIRSGLVVASNRVIDLSNPQIELSDSVTIDNVKHIYKFNKSDLITYHTPPTLKVTDRDAEAGAYGVKEYYGTDTYGNFTVEDIYTVAENGEFTYKYGHPIFVMGDPYKFRIEGFEEYINADSETPVSYRVPLKDIDVMITNELSSVQEVYYQGAEAGNLGDSSKQKITLDDTGQAIYQWRGGFPNINDPYTRHISMSFTIDGKTYDWSGSGMECYLFGELPTGSNFVTAGPDMVDMVLRDPPGSGSNTEWSKGSTVTKTKMSASTDSHDDSLTTLWRGGPAFKVGTGVGLIKFEESESFYDITAGVHRESQTEDSQTTSHVYTATRTIATSDAPEFVGSMGDIYIGSSTNLNFGDARRIDLHRPSPDGEPEISRKDVTTTGMEYSTIFTYSQFFVENTLLPNYSKLIESKLVYADEGTIDSYTNTGDNVVYLTHLRPGDKRYGTRNDDATVWGDQARSGSSGPSYWMFAPDDENVHTDSIGWLNNQIDIWKKTIALNERDKVEVYHKNKSRYFIHNLSFDGGARVTYSEQNDNSTSQEHDYSWTVNAVAGAKSGYTFNKVGVNVELASEHGGGKHFTESEEKLETATFTYNLAEDDWDVISVDVMKSAAEWSPVFHTRAGQTSAPYEGEERTKYYEPGHYTLHEATMQMEVPRISVENPVATNIPVGSKASYKLLLGNDSECSYDFYFRLLVTDESNPNGAALTLDGQPLTEGRRIKVPAGTTLEKTLLLGQSRTDVLDYNDIRLVLASETQNDPTSTMAVIADTCSISAHFVPSSSPVRLNVPRTIINTVTGTKLPLSFDGFERSYAGLKAMRFQYRLQGNPSWTLEREYVLDEKDLSGNNELLPEEASVPFEFDMSNLPDGAYVIRMLSVSTYGEEEITVASEEVELTKDTARPAPISLPTPSDGLLGPGDELSVTFNEDLRQGYITAADNITVRARLNDAEVSHDGVFHSSGGEGASTNVPINLSSGSFTFGTWVKWSAEGTLLRHGTSGNNLELSIDSEGKLHLSLGNETYISQTAIPRDKWCYLNVAYDRNLTGARVNADIAYDSSTSQLFSQLAVGEYAGNGMLTVGRGITASIHELTLWNYARDFAKAQSEINTVKAANTEGLIGYWRLDEGSGTTGTDIARMRHLTLPSASCWSLEHPNIALQLAGNGYAEASLAKAAMDGSGDYLLEFWFKGEETESDVVLMQMPADGMSLVSTSADGLSLRLPDGKVTLGAKRYLDNNWHHFALNVLKGSAGTATAYIDGSALAQIPVSRMPSPSGGSMILGAERDAEGVYGNFMTGSFDEVRFWHATRTAESIRAGMYAKPEAGASGLAAYFPMERHELDGYGQTVVTPDLADKSADPGSGVKVYSAGAEVIVGWDTQEAPAVKDAPRLQDVRFSFVTSERKVLINLEETPARTEGCTIEVNVYGLQDACGNFSQPVTWTAYVKRNALSWEEESKDIVMDVTEEASFDVNIINSSSSTATWSLSGLPIWLEADRLSGTLTPLSSRTLHFTVAPGTSTGRYETVISLCGDDGLSDPLVVNLSVRASRPDWSVDPSRYEYTMNVVGRLKVDDVYSEDADDMVAAFIDGECRGVASPAYLKRYDTYYLMFNIYGDAADVGKDIDYKVFDASAGVVLPEVQLSERHSFAQDVVKGSILSPIIFNAIDSREQIQTLQAGWNWVSLYVHPYDDSPEGVLANITAENSLIKSKSSYSIFNGTGWSGHLTTLIPGEMYKIQAGEETLMQVRGDAIENAAHPITVSPGWNWIGYDNNFYMSLGEALAGLAPEDGDMIKGRDSFAIYMDYEWVGSLSLLTPGSGYIYNSAAANAKTFTYPATSTGVAETRMPRRSYEESLTYTPCDIHKYQGNMTMVAQVRDQDNNPVPCEVAVLDGSGECRGVTPSLGDDELHYLTIQGENNSDKLTFRIVYKDAAGQMHDVQALQTINYVNDAMLGTPSSPYVLSVDISSGIRDVEEDGEEEIWYDLVGRRLKNPDNGVYIRVTPSGKRDVRIRR